MNDSEKSIKNMTIAEILRRQMELLAEASENCCSIEELIELTQAIKDLAQLVLYDRKK